MPHEAHYEVYTDEAGESRWRLRDANGEIIANGEGYASLTGAIKGIAAVREVAADAEVEDLTGSAGGG